MRGLSVSPTFAKGGYRLEHFQDLPIGLPGNIDDDLSTKPSVHASFRRFLALGTGHVKTRDRQLNYARFYAYLIREVDRQILKLIKALDDNGLTDNTVIDEIRWPELDDFPAAGAARSERIPKELV